MATMRSLLRRPLCLLTIIWLPAVVWSQGVSPHLLLVAHWAALFCAAEVRSPRQSAGFWFLAAVGYYGICLWWLGNIFGLMAVALVLILALFHYGGGLLVGWVRVRLERPWLRAALASAVVLSIEYFRCEWFHLRFPWFTAGMAAGPSLLSPIVGIYGVSFVWIFAAACLVFVRNRVGYISAGLAALVGSLPVIDLGKDGRALPVLAMQFEEVGFPDARQQTLAVGEFRDGVILWPEYSVPMDVRQVSGVGLPKPSALESLKYLAAKQNCHVILGHIAPQEKVKDGVWNQALTIGPDGIVGTHEKNRTVHFMQDGTPSRRAEAVTTQWGKIATPICFDNDFTEVVRHMAADGAEVFLVPSMDAKAWSRQQHLQHGRLFQCRAAEMGRWYAVAATSGVTQIISPKGEIVAIAPLMEQTHLKGEVFFRQEQTFFVRAGWMFPWLVVGVAGFCLLALKRVRSPKGVAGGR